MESYSCPRPEGTLLLNKVTLQNKLMDKEIKIFIKYTKIKI